MRQQFLLGTQLRNEYILTNDSSKKFLSPNYEIGTIEAQSDWEIKPSWVLYVNYMVYIHLEQVKNSKI